MGQTYLGRMVGMGCAFNFRINFAVFIYRLFSFTQHHTDTRRADRAAGLLALVGVVNVPIIYFSVKWWNTLHQGASVSVSAAPRMASIMLIGMLIMAIAFWLYAIATALARTRILIREREAQSAWIDSLEEQT